MTARKVEILANAKLNLYLDIVGKLENGFHALDTVMQSVDLCDVLNIEIREEKIIEVSCSDEEIPQNEKNICHKAAGLFFEKTKLNLGARIHIEKHIPSGAGLGGGSADAAAALAGLNFLCGEPVKNNELLSLGEKVGADVPFCLFGGISRCGGIGGEISKAEPLPERNYLIIMPNFKMSTAEAYAKYDEEPVLPKNGAEEFLKSGEDFPQKLYNVFETVHKNEKIYEIKNKLRSSGAQGALLTGSGAAVFGVFKNEEKARNAAKAFPEYFSAVCKAAKHGVLII